MTKENMQKIRIEHHPFLGFGWYAAWLFSVGFLRLTFWKAVFALLIWPYYLGARLSAFLH